jgi:hypothetical protein
MIKCACGRLLLWTTNKEIECPAGHAEPKPVDSTDIIPGEVFMGRIGDLPLQLQEYLKAKSCRDCEGEYIPKKTDVPISMQNHVTLDEQSYA